MINEYSSEKFRIKLYLLAFKIDRKCQTDSLYRGIDHAVSQAIKGIFSQGVQPYSAIIELLGTVISF